MIELRWLKDPKARPIYDIGEEFGVLQYRQHTGDKIATIGVDGVAITITDEWSDWQDVPIVTEERKNA